MFQIGRRTGNFVRAALLHSGGRCWPVWLHCWYTWRERLSEQVESRVGAAHAQKIPQTQSERRLDDRFWSKSSCPSLYFSRLIYCSMFSHFKPECWHAKNYFFRTWSCHSTRTCIPYRIACTSRIQLSFISVSCLVGWKRLTLPLNCWTAPKGNKHLSRTFFGILCAIRQGWNFCDWNETEPWLQCFPCNVCFHAPDVLVAELWRRVELAACTRLSCHHTSTWWRCMSDWASKTSQTKTHQKTWWCWAWSCSWSNKKTKTNVAQICVV